MADRRGSKTRSRPLIVTITGGSGALGSHVARLIYTRWREVREIRLLDVVPPDQSRLLSITGYSSTAEDPKVSFFHGDMAVSDTLLPAFVKADVVVHCAGIVEDGSPLTRKRMSLNVLGAKNVTQCCLDCGVSALIFAGTLSQVMAATNGTGATVRYEELMAQPTSRDRLMFRHYGASKAEAERLILQANGSVGTSGRILYTCSLRLPVMYGERDTLMVPTALGAARRCSGYFLAPWSSARMQSLYFGNAAWAFVMAAQKLLDARHQVVVGGKFYYVADHTPASTAADFYAQFLVPLGYRVSYVKIPTALLMVLAYLLELVAVLLAWVNVDLKGSLNRASVQYLRLDHTISWNKAKVELGYEPLFDHSTAVARSLDYYRTRF